MRSTQLFRRSATASSRAYRRGICAGHQRRTRRIPDRHQGRVHPVRPVGQPGLLRVVVPVPRQQRVGLGGAGRRRLPLRLPPAQGPLRSAEPARARQQGRRGAAARFPGARPAPGTGGTRVLPVLRDHRLGQTPGQRTQGRPGRDGHRAARPGRRADRGFGTGRRRRRDGRVQHERRAAGGPRRAAHRLRPDRRAHAAVLRGHLVPDGLRDASPRQGGVRNAEAPAPDGPLPPVHRPGRRHVGDPVGRAALLPGPGPARPQRRPR